MAGTGTLATRATVPYDTWVGILDAACVARYGFGVDDGASAPLRDLYDAGRTVTQAVRVWLSCQDDDDDA